MAELPLYRAKKKSYVHDRLVQVDEEFTFEGIPSRHWTPLNEAAKKQSAKLNDPFTQNQRAIKAAQAPVQDGNPDDQGGGKGDEGKGDELTPAQKQKALLDALATLKHDDDTHWTKQGDPDLTVLKEKLGYAVSRGEVKEAAPEFVREKPAA